MQFLYRAPVGLVQFAGDGSVEMMNPMAAQLLMPLSPAGGLDNLYAVLESVAPQLRQLATDFQDASGTVCDSLRIALPAVGPAGGPDCGAHQVLAISLMKLDARRLMAMVSDATQAVQREQQGLNRRLKAASRVDGLTQMPNREVARELIAQTLACAASDPEQAFAVLFINCDRFRQINDALGHAAGDEVLGLVADRLRSALRRRRRADPEAPAADSDASGPLAARLGGDEFVVLLGDLHNPEDAHAVAQRLVATLGHPYTVRGQQLHCTVSIGVVFSGQAQGDADAVLQDASIAMAEAKRAGGSRYLPFEPAMQERAARRSGLESDLRLGLARGQFFVLYQPVVGLQNPPGGIDHAAGVEALVRWQHPQRGVVSPVDFIGVAEDCGLIGELGHFVLATACRQFVGWKATLGSRAPRLLAVNLSRSQLAQPGFVASVAQVLATTRMPPAQLQLEVTESLAAQDETVRDSLMALKALGLTLALDDFGTGYSSLASLHLLPVDTVKIDRSFVSEAVTSAHHRVLIEATVRVARSLHMSTVAEGIETAGQAAVVREMGCEKGQGYLFSKPLSAADLAAWLNRNGSPAPPVSSRRERVSSLPCGGV
jgi:diguanylate cyclase (GGDEF)-like protein